MPALPYYYSEPFYLIAFIILIPCLLIAGFAQAKISLNFGKYTKVQNSNRLTGVEAARKILNGNSLSHIAIQHTASEQPDHYDPKSKVIRLSDDVYESTSLTAAVIAAHECGHAIQDVTSYQPMRMRTVISPLATFATQAAWLFILAGLILAMFDFAVGGIYLLGIATVLQLVTLPVELNASSRALNLLQTNEILADSEMAAAKKVLSAAALTYVAALIKPIISLFGVLRMILTYRRNRW